LTRRVIDAFPEDKLFAFSVGGMRPFGALALEMITMAVPMVQGAVSGDWNSSSGRDPRLKQAVLQRDPSPRSGLCVPACPRHRATRLLRPKLTDSATGRAMQASGVSAS